MSCQTCFKELRPESNLHIRCCRCGSLFHPPCLEPEVLTSYFTATRERRRWYCPDCPPDTDPGSDDCLSLFCGVMPHYHYDPREVYEEYDHGTVTQVMGVDRPGLCRNRKKKEADKKKKTADKKNKGGKKEEQEKEPGDDKK